MCYFLILCVDVCVCVCLSQVLSVLIGIQGLQLFKVYCKVHLWLIFMYFTLNMFGSTLKV